MIRRLLRRLTRTLSGDIYVVRDRGFIVGVSARLQGAEWIRSTYASGFADPGIQRRIYDRLTIENYELQDVDD